MKKIIEYTPIVKTIPELSKQDGGVYTCSVGYSPQEGFIRVYPLPLNGMKRWGIYQIEVEKNKHDSRLESWKLSTYTRKDNFLGFEKELIFKGMANKDLILRKAIALKSNSLDELNAARKSVGFIVTDKINAYWRINDRFINTAQLGLFEDVQLADFTKYMKETKEKQSRLTFADMDGKHDLMLNDWQFYEYQRKFGATPEAFRFVNGKMNVIILGNMFQYRSTWIALGCYAVDKIYNPEVMQQPKLFH